jgi:uncharacterized membrane protein YfcA
MVEAWELAALIFLAAALYSSVGHAGASGYLAAMAIVGLAPETMRPTALALNILVATIATARYARAGQFDWRTFWPFALASVPAAFFGGMLHLPTTLYRSLVGVILLLSALELVRSARRSAAQEVNAPRSEVPIVPALLIGAAIGLLSGLTGTGGGIFLSPVLLFLGWAQTRKTSGVSAAFILLNSVAALAGTTFALSALPPAIPLWLLAATVGALLGTQLGTRLLPVPALRYALSMVLVIAGAKLILA